MPEVSTTLHPTEICSVAPIQESFFTTFQPEGGPAGADDFLEAMLAGQHVDAIDFFTSAETVDVSNHSEQYAFSGNVIVFPEARAAFKRTGQEFSIDAFLAQVSEEEQVASENSENTILVHPKLQERFHKYTLDDFDRVKARLSDFKREYGGLYDQIIGNLMDRAAQIGAMCGGHSHDSSSGSSARSDNSLDTDWDKSSCLVCGGDKASCDCRIGFSKDDTKEKVA